MSLQAGTRLGPYEIGELLGAGGMGEVYRARDTRIGRWVAVKVISPALAADAGQWMRLEREARAVGSLSHPNILAIHDVGEHEGAPFFVSELLEGETLRRLLAKGPLAPRRAADVARQVAEGLAAAHAKGIIHRDIKPENLFVTREGRVKILDFGVARRLAPDSAEAELQHEVTLEAMTRPGVVLGSYAYMAPEQARGEPVDARSDVFALGAVLYEMLAGAPAFAHATSAETLAAVLREEPPDLSAADARIPPPLARVVGHCLEKQPERRFQAAQDVAFALAEVSVATNPSGASLAAVGVRSRRRLWFSLLAVALAAGTLALGWIAGQTRGAIAPPQFERLTLRRGVVGNASFAHDGQTVVYDARFDGAERDIFAVRADDKQSRPLGLPRSTIYSVSSLGEMAIGIEREDGRVLARVPLSGGAPREVLERCADADWSPDGQELAAIRHAPDPDDPSLLMSFEFPLGNKVFGGTAVWLSNASIHPDGMLASIQSGTEIQVLGRDGTARAVPRGDLQGTSWSPTGDEIWGMSVRGYQDSTLVAVSLTGHERVLWSGPGFFHLLDVSRSGRALVKQLDHRVGIRHGTALGGAETDLSWLDWSELGGISNDGQMVLFNELGASVTDGTFEFFVRSADGSPAVQLGEGWACGFSPDGQSVLVAPHGSDVLAVVPIGAGSERRLPLRTPWTWHGVHWLAGDRILARHEDSGRVFVSDLAGGQPKDVMGLPVGPLAPSPDGLEFATAAPDATLVIHAIDGGDIRPVTGSLPGDEPICWALDGGLYVGERGDSRFRISRIDVATGARTPWRELETPSADVKTVFVSADASSYAYSYSEQTSVLYLIDGLR